MTNDKTDKDATASGGQAAAETGTPQAGERISKVVSRAGVASRRDVERMIEEGRVTMNGAKVTTPVTLVGPNDRISIDGTPLPAKERTRLFLYHKPVGLVTTDKDPEDRPTVFSELPPDLPRLLSVGRLDINTEGLLLLTNDGGLARLLEHPTTGWLRRYRVRAFGEVTQDQLDGLKDGIEIDGIQYGPVEAHMDREQGSNIWLTLGLREGKNREVKRILEHFGLKVNRLIRVSFGPFQLGELPAGEVEEIRTRTLKDQLSPELARKAGVDFVGEEARPREPERPGRGSEKRGQQRAGTERRGPPGRGPQGGNREGRPASGQDAPAPGVSRKAEAIAQGRRNAHHRHSWQDADTWRDRHQRKGKPASTHGEPRAPGRDASAPAGDDKREHVRGGRIADRKGHSVRVEHVVRSRPAAPPAAAKAAYDANDTLRRKTRREQGLAPRFPRETSRPDARAGDRPDTPRRPRPTGERPARPPFREREGGGEASPRPARPYAAKPARFGKPDGDRPPRGDRPARPPFREREGGGEARPRPARPYAAKPVGFSRPDGERPPRGDRPARPPFREREGGGEARPRPTRPYAAKPAGFSRPDGERSPRGDRPARPPFREREGGGEARPRPARPYAGKPGFSRPDGDRSPRGDRPDRPSRPPFREREGGGEARPRPARPYAGKPARFGKPDGERPPRGDRPTRPPFREREGGASGERPRPSGPPRGPRPGGPPRSGARPFGGGGRPPRPGGPSGRPPRGPRPS